MSSKDKSILNNLEKNNSISLNNFLISYCGICNKTLLKEKISHKDIKYLLPEIKRVSYDYLIKNVNEIYTGNIILVRDSYGNFAPYINPKLNEYKNIEIFDIENQTKDIFDIVVDLENLNTYQLSLLAKKYKQQNRMKEYRKVYRMIKSKKSDGITTYHKKKEKILLKGREENDEY